jgi:hypothetical protein
MTWRIHAWNAASGTGAVVSPHLGPYPFGPDANPVATTDFAPGEPVLVELDGTAGDYRVRTVTAARQRQPAATGHAALDALNALDLGDLAVDEQTPTSLRLWLGFCCVNCSPSAHITFRGVSSVIGLDADLVDPWFRLASPDERSTFDVPPGSEAYCIVTDHGDGRDGPLVFIVASSLIVEDVRR